MVQKRNQRQLGWILISILALMVVLAACSSGAQPNNAPAEENTSGAQNAAPTENTTVVEEQPAAENSANEQPAEESSASGSVSYSADVFPIFESRCIQCHGGERTEGELVLTSYDSMMSGGKDGVVVVPGDSENSLMAQLILDQKMPKRGPKLTPAQTQLIVDWINQGAENN